MSWFGSRSNANPSRLEESSSHVNKQKHKQIDSLREQIPGVVEVIRDEQYSLTTTTNGLTLILNIYLPPRFPLVGPEVTVTPPVQHPWINDQMIIDGSPLLKNFNVHSKLGRAIEQVLREFQERPPCPTSPTPYPSGTSQGSMPGIPTVGSFPSTSSSGFAPYHYSSVPTGLSNMQGDTPESFDNKPRRSAPILSAGVAAPKRYKCPPIPEKFEQVSEMSTEDLKRFLSDLEGPVLVDKFVSELDVTKMIQRDRENLFQDNEDQAAINLGHEPELQEGWTELQEKFLELETLKEEYDKKLSEQQLMIERYQPKNVIAQLKTGYNDADTDSEICADEFLDAKVQPADFVQKYKELRKLHHLRKTKYEKLLGH